MARWNKGSAEVAAESETEPVKASEVAVASPVEIVEILNPYTVVVKVGDEIKAASVSSNRIPRPKIGDVVTLNGDRLAK